MAQRRLITFPDEQDRLLRELSLRTGAPVTELIRRAVADAYGGQSERTRRLKALQQGLGVRTSGKEGEFAAARSNWPTIKEW